MLTISFEWDEGKRLANIKKHGIDFAVAMETFDWASAAIFPDQRREYGEDRFLAFGYIQRRLHVIVFTRRNGVTRIIGLRKTNVRERSQYVQKT